jgi:hypothetical protein
VSVEIEMIVDRGMNGGKFLQDIYVPELRHRSLPSLKWLMGISGSEQSGTAAIFSKKRNR